MVIEAYKHILKAKCIDRNSNFFSCGGDSLSAVELIGYLESKLALAPVLEELPVWSSIAEIAVWLHDFLEANLRRPDDRVRTIFEADFLPCSFRFRPRLSAHDAPAGSR